MAANKVTFGQTKDGREAHLITLTNKNGMRADVTDYGATLVSLFAPDKAGNMADIIWGFNHVSGYENSKAFFGSTVGRHAGRIKHGAYSINGKDYQLVINDRGHTVHGGPDSFHSRLFHIESLSENHVVFTYLSPDGEAHFPGNLQVTVTYRLLDDNSLCIDFDGQSDADTILSMTNHAYFNLDGPGSPSILDHQFKVPAETYTEVTAEGLPTGRLLPVDGTPYDFREFQAIGARIHEPEEGLVFCDGYDHTFVIAPEKFEDMRLSCEVKNSTGTRHLQLFTNQPGLQFYTGNYLNGTEQGKDGSFFGRQSALCIEPQIFADALNHPHFPSPILKAGETYCYRSIYKFI